MDHVLELIGRNADIFLADMMEHEEELATLIHDSRFLVIGGAGSIGQAVTKEIFKRDPKLLHIVDISENNMVELVRDLRSSIGYIKGEFATFAIDVGSTIFDSFIENGMGYDYVLNLSALKHVRSEKDPYTLMRMIDVNILNTDKTVKQACLKGAKKYFCVSTDKAANPVNMMGASKRIMEFFLMQRSMEIPVSTARFANVAFSDGSLVYGFNQRLDKEQPLSAPYDVRRYFITPSESGQLCVLSAMLGSNRDLFFPKLDSKVDLISFKEIALRFLERRGYEPVECESEDEARAKIGELKKTGKWPVYFFASDTTGEKEIEEFYTDREVLDFNRFKSVGVIVNSLVNNDNIIKLFESSITRMKTLGKWTRDELVALFKETIPEFSHKETGKFLDSKM